MLGNLGVAAILSHRSLKLIDMAENDLRNHLIEEYFHMGFNYKEIIDCLFLNNGIPLSLRQLKRILAKKNLERRRFSSLDEIADAIEEELKG